MKNKESGIGMKLPDNYESKINLSYDFLKITDEIIEKIYGKDTSHITVTNNSTDKDVTLSVMDVKTNFSISMFCAHDIMTNRPVDKLKVFETASVSSFDYIKANWILNKYNCIRNFKFDSKDPLKITDELLDCYFVGIESTENLYFISRYV